MLSMAWLIDHSHSAFSAGEGVLRRRVSSGMVNWRAFLEEKHLKNNEEGSGK